MLVNGQILMGTISPSHVCMMEFVVAAQGIIKETLCTALQDITYPNLLCKINQLNSVIASNLCYFLTTKSNQKLLGCLPACLAIPNPMRLAVGVLEGGCYDK